MLVKAWEPLGPLGVGVATILVMAALVGVGAWIGAVLDQSGHSTDAGPGHSTHVEASSR